jgi:sugar diacid utilization regulator
MGAQMTPAELGVLPARIGREPDAAALAERRHRTHLEMVDAVVAGADLAHVAEIAGRATGSEVAISVPRLGPPAVTARNVPEDEVLAFGNYVADRLRDRPAEVPEWILHEVPVTAGEEPVGLVALVGRPARGAHAETIEILHLAAAAAVTKLAIEEARHEVEEGLRDSFMEELRSAAPLSAADIVRRAVRLGCDVTRGAVVLCADGDPDRPRRTMATIAAEIPDALMQSLDGRVYAVIPAGTGEDPPPSRTPARVEAVAARLRRFGTVGISSFYRDPADLRSALQEAELMADVLRASGAPSAQIAGTGTYRLLLRLFVTHPDEVRSFFEGTVGPIVRYDEHYGTDLVATLESYLEHNCNMNATAAAVYAHRHTIAYRLERVRELTDLDPSHGEHRERLGLGLKAYRILAPRG